MDFEKTLLAAHPHTNICRLVLFLTPLRSRWTVPLTASAIAKNNTGFSSLAPTDSFKRTEL